MHFEEKSVNILKKSGEKAKKWIIENSVMADEDNRNLDCGFSRGDKWFRFRVGAIIIEEEKILFVRNRREEFYYTVGGGVHLGETSEEAIEREVYEETGLKYEVDRIAFIHEYFFYLEVDDIRRECQEISFYYLMKPMGRRMEITKESRTLGVREEFHWLALKELEKYEGYPEFLHEMIKNVRDGKRVGHLVTRRVEM